MWINYRGFSATETIFSEGVVLALLFMAYFFQEYVDFLKRMGVL